MNKIKGIRTGCTTGEKKEVTLEYKIIKTAKGAIFQLHGGPTGFESFCIENQLREFEEAQAKYGGEACWVACMGDVGYNYPVYDRLVVPATEMIRVLKLMEEQK